MVKGCYVIFLVYCSIIHVLYIVQTIVRYLLMLFLPSGFGDFALVRMYWRSKLASLGVLLLF